MEIKIKALAARKKNIRIFCGYLISIQLAGFYRRVSSFLTPPPCFDGDDISIFNSDPVVTSFPASMSASLFLPAEFPVSCIQSANDRRLCIRILRTRIQTDSLWNVRLAEFSLGMFCRRRS